MRFYYFILLLGWGHLGFTQNFDALVNAPPSFVKAVDLDKMTENQLFISMPFAQKTVLNPEQKRMLHERVVVKLTLVYTQFRTVASFNQKQLNRRRLIELNELVPFLFENRFWEFELVSQTNGNSREFCNNMFHGFIISFRPNSSKATLNLEADYVENLLSALIQQDSLVKDTTPQSFTIKTHYDKQIGYVHDTIWYADTLEPLSPPDFFYDQSLYKDTTVLSAFNRNKTWKNLIVVTDVTGSMSPYISQVMVWLKAQAEQKTAAYFVFFNDGDDKASTRKKPLETKGVYVAKNKDLKTVINKATQCMRNGSGGGEFLENDVEAIIEGLKQHPNATEIILVADNRESMRDYKFIAKIKKPVHVILCGSEFRINIQYLDLARQTKGSIHTIKSDVDQLHRIKEKEHFFIDEKEYLYEKGRFHSVYSKMDQYK